MPVSGLLSEGLNLLVLGMGTVFAFLALLVWAVGVMSRFAQAIESRKPPPALQPARSPRGGGDLVAVIAAAVHRYRTEHPH